MDITKYLINTAPVTHLNELGIFKFAKDFFPERFKNEFDVVHYDMITAFFEMYAPYRYSREDRKGYAIVHREAAKTTFITFLMPTYMIFTKGMPWYLRARDGTIHTVKNEERFILIANETKEGAERFTMNIRSVINKRADLAAIFGEKSPREMPVTEDDRRGENMWKRSAFITLDGTAVVGVGSGQQIRGVQIEGSRPTVLIMDDMFSNKNTLTDKTRDKVKSYINTELEPAVDTIDGKVFLGNTIVHRDTHAYEVTKNPNWTGIQKPVIELDELSPIIAKLARDEEGHYLLPTYADCLAWEKDLKTLSWKSRHNLMVILQRYCDAARKGQLKGFYREFLNITRPPESDGITEEQILMTDFTFDKGTCYFQYEGLLYKCKPKWQVGIDIATSDPGENDESCIAVSAHVQCTSEVAGTNDVKYRNFAITCHIEGGSYAALPNEEDLKQKSYVKSIIDISRNIGEIGTIYMEQNGQQKGIIDSTKQGLRDRNYHFTIVGVISAGNKVERISSDLKVWVAAHNKILIPKNAEGIKMKNQVVYLGETNLIDYADSLSISTKGLALRAQPSQYLQDRLDDFRNGPDRNTPEAPDWLMV